MQKPLRPFQLVLMIFLSAGILFCLWGCSTGKNLETGAPEHSTADSAAPKPMVEPEPLEKEGYGMDMDAGASASSASAPPPSKGKRSRKIFKTSKKSSSGLKAGFSDDNKQFNFFVKFLEKFKHVQHVPVNIFERIIIKVTDDAGKPVPNASVAIFEGSKKLESGQTYADGTFMLFPSEYKSNAQNLRAAISYNTASLDLDIDRNGPRSINAVLDTPRGDLSSPPVDIVFILDTTGSMGEEINRLKKTIEIINLNLASLPSTPKIRFGMVLYKDTGDAYVTKVVPITSNLEEFTAQLNKVGASGGGDTPEDLEAALYDAVEKLEWNRDGIRLGFVITDAPPHLDYQRDYNYSDTIKKAKKAGIKISTIGVGGLNLTGEYILRQIAQYTYGKYIFLTYGEKGESAGGKAGSVSHHTGANFQTGRLEAIIIRIAKEEISFLTDQPLLSEEEFFEANKIKDEQKEETLGKLFDMAVSQLIDYSPTAITDKPPAAVIGISAEDKSLGPDAEFFTHQLVVSFAKNKSFTAVERADMQKILLEQKLSMTGLIDAKGAAEAGKLIGAKMIVTGRLMAGKGKFVIFLKLIRVETAELLSATKLVVDRGLGISE